MAEENATEPTNVEEVVDEQPETPPEPTEESQEEPDQEEVEEIEPEGEPEESQDEPEPEEEEKPPSRRESLRIQQLLEKMKQPQQQQYQQPQPSGLNYSEALDADPETIAQLEADRQQVAQQQYQQGIAQAESIKWESRLEIDAPKVESKYPQFDKNSAEFDPALADSVNQMYLQMVGYDANTGMVQNPQIRYADYIESIAEQAERMAGNKVARAQKNIARQAAATGLRPDGSAAKTLNLDPSKDPKSMTDKELEAMIEISMPKN
jgi:hypothetical protein